MGREDARVKLHVPWLVHTVHVTERRGNAEVWGNGGQRLMYGPDLRQA